MKFGRVVRKTKILAERIISKLPDRRMRKWMKAGMPSLPCDPPLYVNGKEVRMPDLWWDKK